MAKETTHSSGLTDTEALSLFKNIRAEAETTLTTKQDIWLQNYEDTYIFENRSSITNHKIFVPMIYSILWNVLPRLVGNQPRFVVTPRGKRVDKDKVDQLQEFLGTHEWQRSRMKTKVRELTQSAAVYGTSFSIIDWEEKPLMVWSRKEGKNVPVKDKDGNEKKIGKNKITVLDIFDAFTDPTFSDVQDSPYFLYVRRDVPRWQMEKLGLRNLDQIAELTKTTTTDKGENNRRNKFLKQRFNLDQGTNKLKDSHDLWYLYTHNEDGEPIQIIVIDANVIGQNQLNPFPHEQYPVVKTVYQENSTEAYGTGLAALLKGHQDENNHTRSNRLDSVDRAIKGFWGIDKSKGQIDLSQFGDRTKDFIEGVDIANTLIPLQLQDVTGNAYNETQQMEVDAQVMSGINNFTQDQASGFNTTARGAVLVNNLANIRMTSILDNIEASLARMGEMMLQNTLAFQDDDIIEKLTGEEGEDFNLADFDFPFNIGVETGSTSVLLENREQELATIMLQSLTPFAQAGLVDMKELLEDFIRSNKKDPKKLIPEEQAPAEGQPPQEGAPRRTWSFRRSNCSVNASSSRRRDQS